MITFDEMFILADSSRFNLSNKYCLFLKGFNGTISNLSTIALGKFSLGLMLKYRMVMKNCIVYYTRNIIVMALHLQQNIIIIIC